MPRFHARHTTEIRYSQAHATYLLPSRHVRLEDVVRLRRGVCQEMAHLFIALCRRRGVAARYVSGWMHNPHRAGPGASHAWAEAAVPGHGWMEVDPTNPGSSLERHVRLAVGRDYDDVPPLRGRFRGRTAQELRVSVELHAVEG